MRTQIYLVNLTMALAAFVGRVRRYRIGRHQSFGRSNYLHTMRASQADALA